MYLEGRLTVDPPSPFTSPVCYHLFQCFLRETVGSSWAKGKILPVADVLRNILAHKELNEKRWMHLLSEKKILDEKRKVFRGVRGGIEWPSSVRMAGIQTGVVRGALSDIKWFYGDTFILEKAFICFCLFHLGIYVFLK